MRDPLELGRHLTRSANRFDFFQALRLIECVYHHLPRLGKSRRPRHDPVRVGQRPSLEFAGADMAGYVPATDSQPARLDVTFGLLGSDGPMPLHLTEYVAERARGTGDHTLKRFLDVFHHRMSVMLYRAWATGQPVVNADRRDDDNFANCLASLGGFSTRPSQRQDVVGERARLSFCSLLSNQARNASGLELLLSQAFGLPVMIEQFVGQWLQLPHAQCTRLGARSGTPLGLGLAVGRKVWDRQQKIRVIFGPLDATQSRCLQPGSTDFRRLSQWVRFYIGPVTDWDLELRLKAEVVVATRLGHGTRLARDTWLGRPKSDGNPPSLRFRGSV